MEDVSEDISVAATNKFQRGVLAALPPAQLSALIGEITALMLTSKVHRQLQIRDIADIILPAINMNQYRIYRTARRQPIALVTWAKFSEAVEQKYLAGKAVLSEAELCSGPIIYITDFIAPYGHVNQIKRDLQGNLFPNDTVKALRFVEYGKARPKVWQFHGVNYQKPLN